GPCLEDDGLSWQHKYNIAISETIATCGASNVVILSDYLTSNGWLYPTAPSLARKIVIYFPRGEFATNSPDKPPGTLWSSHTDECTTYTKVVQSTLNGQPADDNGHNNSPNPNQVMRLDQYQNNWTFDYGVPPNPLVVDSSAQ